MYIGHPSELVAKYLKKLELNISFKTNNNLQKYIKNNKSKTNNDKKAGVYKLICGSCDMIYIGRTSRNFLQRKKEHFRDYFYQHGKSNYAEHLIDKGHIFNKDYEVLHVENKSK